MPGVQIDRPLFLADDGETLVEAGDPRAASVWALEGSTRSSQEVERVGYKPQTKSAPKPANKAQPAPSEDKSEEHACDECDFVAKTAAGLASHQRSHED